MLSVFHKKSCPLDFKWCLSLVSLKNSVAGSFCSSLSHVLRILYLKILLIFQVYVVVVNLVIFTMCYFFFFSSRLGFKKKEKETLCFIISIMIAVELGDI